jgi:Alpha/beta hydrolase domain
MLRPAKFHNALPTFLVVAFSTAAVCSVDARVTKIVISQKTSPIFAGRSFGAAGQYEEIKGTASGEIDPNDRRSAVITDIELAPRNARGMVEYVATFTMVKPVDMSKASGLMTYEVVNRSSHLVPGRYNIGGDPGDGFVYNTGDVLLWSGWQGAMAFGGPGETIQLPVARNPDGSSVTGPVLWRFINVPGNVNTQYFYRFVPNSIPGIGRTPLTLDTSRAMLISATSESPSGAKGGVTPIASGDWAFADCTSVPFPGTPDPTRICLRNGFNPVLLYELVYTAKDPIVLGVGLAAMRDVVSFFRRTAQDDAGTANPVANQISYVMGHGISQSGRYIKAFLNLGFNEDESGAKVWDAAFSDIGGAQGTFNIRFADQRVYEQSALYVPGAEGPLWWADYTDTVRNRPPWGILHRCTVTNSCPLVFEAYGGAEYWYGRGTVGIAGTTGVDDIPVPANVRRYYMSGTTHGGGPGGFQLNQPAVTDLNSMACALARNPNPETETLRALYVALKAWMSQGTPPPPSAYPRVPDGTLVPATSAAMGYPMIPGSPSPDGVMNSLLDFDFGPEFRYNDESGVITNLPAPVKNVIPTLAPRVDADGNEVAGIHSLLLRMPLGTYTGWNPVANGVLKGQECVLAGGYIPFAITQAQRLASGDPRLSIEERYGRLGNYYSAALYQAKDLFRQRFLLVDDANRLINQMLSDMLAGGLLH